MSKTRSVGAHSICARGGLSCRKRARADMESAPTFLWRAESRAQRRCPACSFPPLSKTKSVGPHSICARRSVSCCKQARADMDSAPTVLWRQSHRAEAVPRVEFLPLSKAKSVGAHSICARGSLSYRKRARADMESAPTVLWRAEPPPRRGRCPARSFLFLSKAKSVGAHSICARGGLSCRKRARADMDSAPTFFVAGGVPAQRGPRGAFLPVVRANGFILLYFIIRNLQKKRPPVVKQKQAVLQIF